MIYDAYFDDLGLQYIYGCDPYSLDDLYEVLARRARDDGRQGDLSQVMFLDLSQVNLLEQSEPDFRRFIMRRMALREGSPQNQIAFLVGDMGSFGMMRMYGILADMAELREERKMFASVDLNEVARWLAERLDLKDAAALKERLEEAARVAHEAVCTERSRSREGR